MRFVIACLARSPVYAGLTAAVAAIALAFGIAYAFADPRTDCPDATPCKVIVVTAQEEKILTGERGILATAAQARALDLGSLATYFEQKILKAPAGDPKEVPKSVEPAPAK